MWQPRSHGNSLDRNRIFTSNTSSVKAAILQKVKLTGQTPAPVYDVAMKEAAEECGEAFGILQTTNAPRDKKQVTLFWKLRTGYPGTLVE